MFQFVLIGAGNRGMIYASNVQASKSAKVVAIAEPDDNRRAAAAERLQVPEDCLYRSAEDILAAGKLGDVAIIATMDQDHYVQAMKAMELGYDLILEKPISPNAVECLAIAERAKKLGRRVVVCHVLRYAPFFRELKRIVDSQELGKVITIQHNENIGNFHMAHSFVRGNWRNSEQSSPIIMQKSCHDLDYIVWLAGSECRRISSFGSLTYFTKAHAPEGAAERCCDCKYRESCRYSAYVCYLPVLGDWPASSLCTEQTPEALEKAIEEGPYGRCVYHCDNNVCDHMVTNIELKNGITATFNLSAFTNTISRTMKIMCEDGEIRANEALNLIELTRFHSNQVEQVDLRSVHPARVSGGHGGGDECLVNEILELLQGTETKAVSDIGPSVESHLMACAAEESRLSHQVVEMDEFKVRLSTMLP